MEGVPAHCRGVGLIDLWKFFPTPTILWFYVHCFLTGFTSVTYFNIVHLCQDHKIWGCPFWCWISASNWKGWSLCSKYWSLAKREMRQQDSDWLQFEAFSAQMTKKTLHTLKTTGSAFQCWHTLGMFVQVFIYHFLMLQVGGQDIFRRCSKGCVQMWNNTLLLSDPVRGLLATLANKRNMVF